MSIESYMINLFMKKEMTILLTPEENLQTDFTLQEKRT